MDETPAPRKTLSLKGAMRPLVETPAAPEAREVWKCKPCGAVVDLDGVAPGEAVRCGACGARLGKLEQFLADDEDGPKVRARKAVLPPPAPAPPPPVPQIKVRPRRA